MVAFATLYTMFVGLLQTGKLKYDGVLYTAMPMAVLEGLDGSGKSTVIDAIENEYEDVVVTQEPSDLWTGKQVRRCLSDESMDPLTDFYFFMGDRVHHIENRVRPSVEQGKLVVSDRYADSTRAYQPVALSQSDHFADQGDAKLFIDQVMGPWNYKPNLVLYIDISVDTAMERVDADEKYEKRRFLEQVKSNYESLIDGRDNFVVIDGEQSKEDVRNEALRELETIT